MTKQKLLETVALAERFIKEAKILLIDHSFITGTKQSGQVKRLSLDLTRRLAELRKWVG